MHVSTNLNPVESIPANMCLVPVSIMNEAIILANIVPFILAQAFAMSYSVVYVTIYIIVEELGG